MASQKQRQKTSNQDVIQRNAVRGSQDAPERAWAAQMAWWVKVLATRACWPEFKSQNPQGREPTCTQESTFVHTSHIKDIGSVTLLVSWQEQGTAHLLCQLLKLGVTIQASKSTPSSVNRKNEMCTYMFIDASLTVNSRKYRCSIKWWTKKKQISINLSIIQIQKMEDW